MRLDRRAFLKLMGVGIGSVALEGYGLAQANPERFASLLPIPTRRLEPGLLEANLTARVGATRIGGRAARLLTYGGSLLRVRAGDTLRLHFENRLVQPTNLHWHGLHASPALDDPLRVVAPGERVTVEYPVPKNASGLHWIHPHHHGVVAEQQFAGLAAAVVIDSDGDEVWADAEEHVLLLRDLTLVGDLPAPHTTMDWMNGKEGDLLLVNGAVKPTLRARKPWLRLRVVNAANARFYRLQLENHPLYLVGTDGGFLERPVELDELLLAPGERADLLVRLERPGTYRLLNLPYARGTMMMGGGMMNMGDAEASSGATQTLMVLDVPRLPKPEALPTRLATLDSLEVRTPSVRRTITMTERMMGAQFFLNGRAFDERRVDLSARRGALEVWELVNRSDMDHPFHLHTYPFQVLTRNERAAPFRAWRDVVNLRKNDVVRIAVPLESFLGKTVYHCHVLEHEDRGMMGVLEVRD